MLAAGPSVYALRPGSDVGGEVHELELLRRLPGHGVELALGLPRGHPWSSPPAGWRVDSLPDIRRARWPLAPAVLLPWVLRTVRRRRPALLRGGSVRWAGPTLLLARRAARLPVVLHAHHLEPRWARVELALLRSADAVVTVSGPVREALAAGGVARERLHVVPNGVSAPARRDPWPEAWPPGAGPRLLHLGRLEARKRPELALDVLAGLRARGIEARLVLAGDGPLRSALERRAAPAAAVLGRVSEADKWRLLDAADLLLFGSGLEGFGLVAAEAAARGVPVLAAAGTGSADVVRDGETGLLVRGPAAAWVEAAAALLGDPARRAAMAAAARDDAASRFSWDASAARLAEVYASAAAVGTSRGRTSATSVARTASGA